MNEAESRGAASHFSRDAEVEPGLSPRRSEAKLSRPLEALVTCADPEYLYVLTNLLRDCGLTPILSSTVGEAQAIMSRRTISLIFCEDGLPDGGFCDLLAAAAWAGTRIPVVVVSNADDWNHYLRAMRNGAFDYIQWPPRRAEVEWVVHSALRATP